MKKVVILLFIVSYNSALAKIWLPSILSDDMVLQRESVATIWGWSTDTYTNEIITVTGSWNMKSVTTEADQGMWSVKLPTEEAGGPYTVIIEGHDTIKLRNVMIGEVWICSGQSNMEWTPLQGLTNAEDEIAVAQYPNIRFFFLPKHQSNTPQDDTPGHWAECTSETITNASSVSYFFGKKLHHELEIPIGLINTSWGGTPIETWLKRELVENDPELSYAKDKIERRNGWPDEAGSTYNSMIHPLLRFNIAGAIWYQGESNRANPNSYYKSFPLLIESWRKAWNKEFPFYYVQIAPYNYDSDSNIDAAIVRDAQLHTMKIVPNSGMVVTNDIGDLEDIHPGNKQDVGKRLALWALAKTYGRNDLICSGPIFKKIEIQKEEVIVSFDYAENGLLQKGESLKEFWISGKDKIFHRAKANIDGSSVVVSNPNVAQPVAVRFAFSNSAEPNLYNTAGLPASAFRSDNWEIKLE